MCWVVHAHSGCGNYGLVGTRGGHVFRYNMQSGQPRGSYPQSATPSAKAVKALTNVVKPGAIAKITPDGFSSKRIGMHEALVVYENDALSSNNYFLRKERRKHLLFFW